MPKPIHWRLDGPYNLVHGTTPTVLRGWSADMRGDGYFLRKEDDDPLFYAFVRCVPIGQGFPNLVDALVACVRHAHPGRRLADLRMTWDLEGAEGKGSLVPVITFSKVRADGGYDATDTCCKYVDVFEDGGKVGELYREPIMVEWAADSAVEERFGGLVYGTLAECKREIRENAMSTLQVSFGKVEAVKRMNGKTENRVRVTVPGDKYEAPPHWDGALWLYEDDDGRWAGNTLLAEACKDDDTEDGFDDLEYARLHVMARLKMADAGMI